MRHFVEVALILGISALTCFAGIEEVTEPSNKPATERKNVAGPILRVLGIATIVIGGMVVLTAPDSFTGSSFGDVSVEMQKARARRAAGFGLVIGGPVLSLTGWLIDHNKVRNRRPQSR